ncbi:MAG TPA: IPT/TIG domain-containing protein [Solirubrobacterales bacterium]|nr:IPT/TIG domain-containing protein [Solirubrobacterales bacterium]
MSKLRSALLLVLLVSLATATGVEARVVTVGSPASPTTGGENTQPILFINAGTGTAGGIATSPITGTIIRWRVNGFEGPWRLRVLSPNGGPSYTGSGTGTAENVPDKGLHTYGTALPIKAGQTIGIESTGQAWFGAVPSPGASFAVFAPPLPDGATGNAIGVFENQSFTFSADVLPPPAVTTILPASGSLVGGTPVAIAGSDFTEVRSVSFGDAPAASFTVVSEDLITAIAPASAAIGPVPVAVTTVAGTATTPQAFSYEGCSVPPLRGKKLKAAKKAIRKRGCLVGKVRKRKGVTAKTGKIVRQRPKPGQVLPPGAKVNVKLG